MKYVKNMVGDQAAVFYKRINNRADFRAGYLQHSVPGEILTRKG